MAGLDDILDFEEALLRRSDVSSAAKELIRQFSSTQAKYVADLEFSETRSNLIIDSMKDPVIRITKLGVISFASAGVKAFSGYEPADLIGTNIFNYFASEQDAKRGFKAIKHALNTSQTQQEFEYMFAPASGESFPVAHTSNILRDASGLVEGFQLSLRNISAHKKLEHASKERIKELKGQSNLQTLISEATSFTDLAVRFAKEILPNSMAFPEFIHSAIELDGKHYVTCHDHLPGDLPFALSTPILVKNIPRGKFVVGYLENKPFEEGFEQGFIDGCGFLLGKFVEQSESYAESRFAKEDARIAKQARKTFLETLSHELRTPLNGILGFASIVHEESKLLTDDVIRDSFLEYTDIIKEGGSQLLSRIKNILNYTSLSSDNSDLNITTVNVGSLINTLIGKYSSMAAEKNIYFRSDLENDSLIQANEFGMVSVVNNLLENAILYTFDGGVTIKTYTENNALKLRISDTGIGMAEEYLSGGLYEPFSQESEGYSKKHQGMGLGISIAKLYLEKHNFPIFIESTKDVGTEIIITLKNNSNEVLKY